MSNSSDGVEKQKELLPCIFWDHIWSIERSLNIKQVSENLCNPGTYLFPDRGLLWDMEKRFDSNDPKNIFSNQRVQAEIYPFI